MWGHAELARGPDVAAWAVVCLFPGYAGPVSGVATGQGSGGAWPSTERQPQSAGQLPVGICDQQFLALIKRVGELPPREETEENMFISAT